MTLASRNRDYHLQIVHICHHLMQALQEVPAPPALVTVKNEFPSSGPVHYPVPEAAPGQA